MNRISIILVALVTVLVAGATAFTPREAFIQAPRELLPTVDSLTRLDMIDYYLAGSPVASRNVLGGESRVLALNDTLVSVSTSVSSVVDIYVLPGHRDTMSLVVTTLGLPASDSRVDIYDRGWKALKFKKLPASFNSLDMWLTTKDRQQREIIENLVPFIPVKCEFDGSILSFKPTLDSLLTAEDYDKVKPFMRTVIEYVWNGKDWTAVKP